VTSTWHHPVTLTGPTLKLTPLRLADAAGLLDALGGEEVAAEVLENMSYGPPADVAATRTVIAAALADPDRLPYAQRIAGTGELVGTTSFYEINPGARSIAIGHTWVARAYWRTGVNTESKLILLTRAFEGLGAERVVWHTDVRNTRSQLAIERLGATREGVLRHHRLRRDGSWRDTVQYSMLSAEWPAARERLRAAAILRS
jgi:RimJ/RimL family protein N-acetyltransferase